MAAWKLAPALAAGNTCVLKPAETTSITALHLAEIFQQAELPDGVVNIVTGAGPTGKALVEHDDVNKIAFTGSTAVGKMLTRAVAGTKKSELVDSGLQQGAELVQPRLRLPEKGYWYPASFFTGVTASHRIAQEEIFGPVLSVMTFRTRKKQSSAPTTRLMG